jgi:hypothetical protein
MHYSLGIIDPEINNSFTAGMHGTGNIIWISSFTIHALTMSGILD